MRERVPAESLTGGGEGPALLGSGGTRRLTDVKEGCRRGGVQGPKGSTTRACGHCIGTGHGRVSLSACGSLPPVLACPSLFLSAPESYCAPDIRPPVPAQSSSGMISSLSSVAPA